MSSAGVLGGSPATSGELASATTIHGAPSISFMLERAAVAVNRGPVSRPGVEQPGV
jgi:hypothetical protein